MCGYWNLWTDHWSLKGVPEFWLSPPFLQDLPVCCTGELMNLNFQMICLSCYGLCACTSSFSLLLSPSSSPPFLLLSPEPLHTKQVKMSLRHERGLQMFMLLSSQSNKNINPSLLSHLFKQNQLNTHLLKEGLQHCTEMAARVHQPCPVPATTCFWVAFASHGNFSYISLPLAPYTMFCDQFLLITQVVAVSVGPH